MRGFAAVAGVAAAGALALGEASGWMRPGALNASRFADRFEQVYGRHAGFRRNHAKGLAAAGTFTSNGAGREVSRAAVFEPVTVPVIARFSLSGGLPDQPDKKDTVRGLALSFLLPGGQQWRTAMINLPVFPDSTPAGFYERILAAKPDPVTGKPNPQAMGTFLARHPETVAAIKTIKKFPPTAGFADSTFNSLNAFLATNTAGHTVPIRWSAIPADPPASPPIRASTDYLFDALIAHVQQAPLRWRLIVTVGQSEDPTHDATLAWPPTRRTIDTGTITIDAVHTEAAGNARDINFDPLILPDGVAPSDDPIPRARSAVYATSFNRRARETTSPSEVNVEQVSHDS